MRPVAIHLLRKRETAVNATVTEGTYVDSSSKTTVNYYGYTSSGVIYGTTIGSMTPSIIRSVQVYALYVYTQYSVNTVLTVVGDQTATGWYNGLVIGGVTLPAPNSITTGSGYTYYEWINSPQYFDGTGTTAVTFL